MNFFSGFALKGEEGLFDTFLDRSAFCVAGFSKGAIEAVEFALKCESRVDRLQLLSPAFFQHKDEKFRRLQLLHFKRDKDRYIENFLKNISYPSDRDLNRYSSGGSYEALEMLLNYRYKGKDLERLRDRGVLIEVYVADDDIIVDTDEVVNFFEEFATIVRQKRGGHTLWIP